MPAVQTWFVEFFIRRRIKSDDSPGSLACGAHARALSRDHRPALGGLDGVPALEAVVRDCCFYAFLQSGCDPSKLARKTACDRRGRSDPPLGPAILYPFEVRAEVRQFRLKQDEWLDTKQLTHG